MEKFILRKVRTRKRAYNSIEQHALDIAKNINDVTVFVINGDKIKEGKDFVLN